MDETGPPDPSEQPLVAYAPVDGPGSDDAVAFLRTVRELVHGEQVPTPRGGSDAWEAPTGSGPSGWLPGRWEVEPVAAPPGRRRRERAVDEQRRSAKSAKSSRRGRRRRTVETAAQRGAPGAEVPMKASGREPGLTPVAPDPAPVSEEPAGDPSPRAEAKALRAAEKARTARARQEAREQALVDRAAALVAKAEAKAEKDRGRAERPQAAAASADRTAGKSDPAEQVATGRPGDGADAGVVASTRPTRAERKAARKAVRERARLERAAAEAVAAEARAVREAEERRGRAQREATEAARARDRAEREAEEEHARVARIAEEVAETIARLESEAKARAEGRNAKAQARIARVTGKAEDRVARAARRSEAATERASARTERRLRRRAARAQQRADRAAAGARAKSEIAAEHARRAAELEARAIAVDPTGTDERRVERLADYIARVESQRSSRPWRARRTRFGRRAGAVAVGAVIVVAALVPWVAPQVPAAISGILPGHAGKPVHVTDPPVALPTTAFVGPVGVQDQAGPYDGVRLQAAGRPLEVQVGRLHVDSTVLPISGQSGSLLPPSDPQVLGWWKEGRPAGAESGSAVITGHTVHTGGGALDHLDKLVVGDSVRVRTDAGWIRYEVQRTRIYSTKELARDATQIFALGGPGRLVLITCDNWNGSFYESNAVVFAAPVADEPS